jgi:hypothetical protein
MCELAFIEYNPTFDSIMPFPCFFAVFLIIVIYYETNDWFTLFFLEMSKKFWPRFRVRNSTVDCKKTGTVRIMVKIQ